MWIRTKNQEDRRLLILAGAAAVWGAAIVFQLVKLQIWQHDEYLRLAEGQQVQTVEVQAPRGSLFDRNGEPLALSVKVESVFVNPRLVPDLEVAADLLAPTLNLDRKTLFDRLSMKIDTGRGKALRGFVWVKRRITPEEARQLRSLKLDWIGFQSESQRLYPKGALAATVIGGVDHEERGNAGVELKLNDELMGADGAARVLTDVRGASVETIEVRAPQPGTHLVLSIDERIQFLAERELQAACARTGAQTGTLVIMKPDTGDLLAAASYNRADPDSRQNLAVLAPFEPGSVFKVFTIAGALEAGVARPETIFPCGILSMFGRVLHEAKSAYGPMPVTDILVKSSNVGAAQIGLRLGAEQLYESVRKFGFGQKTGVPLPGEETGWLRNVRRWNRDTILSIPMGHEVSTTAVQLARAACVIANGGFLVKPRLVLRKQYANGMVETLPPGRLERVLSPERAHELRQMMEAVVLRGTGKAARLKGYTAGGKTGSAQIYDHRLGRYTHTYNASFLGFAPVTKPAVVVVVTLNGTSGGSAGYGGAAAAPVFQTVTQETLRILDVPKDLPEDGFPPSPEGPAEEDPTEEAPVPAVLRAEAHVDPDEALLLAQALSRQAGQVAGPRVPDFQGKSVRAVMEEASALGLPVILNGKGRAFSQAPPAGAVLPPGQSVRVEFAR